MSRLSRTFTATCLPVSVFEAAVERLVSEASAATQRDGIQQTGVEQARPAHFAPSVTIAGNRWSLNSLEEAFEMMRGGYDDASFDVESPNSHISMMISASQTEVDVEVDARQIESEAGYVHLATSVELESWIHWWAEQAATHQIAPAPPAKPRIFIGHGGDPQWMALQTYLRDRLKLDVRTFETLPAAGRTIERTLGGALDWANFALIVMTAEDQMADRTVRARMNVVHELGLFQGRLGWDNALVLLEEPAEEFSNIAGTIQLRFPARHIQSVFSEIHLALLDRFPELG